MSHQTVQYKPFDNQLAERQFLAPPDDLNADLLLVDRGYFDQQYCRAAHHADGHFIVLRKA